MLEIIRAEYGSRALGISNGSSDRDLMAIVVEDPQFVTGVQEWKGSREGGGSGVGGRSIATDIEIVSYPLRKWARLAGGGNPTVLQLLFTEEFEVLTKEAQRLLSISDAFVSRKAGSAFLGYMQNQRLVFEGKKAGRTNRPELEHTIGFDSKYAAHWLRLGMQGIELMSTGRMSVPLEEADRDVLLDIRAGRMNKAEVLQLGVLLETNLIEAISESELPEEADWERINRTLHEIYMSVWTL